jgi:predicted ester cyclase
MDSKATVQALMDSVQTGDFEKARSLLAADFQFSGPVPQPISGEAWLAMSKNLKAAFPDLAYRFQVESMEGDTANIAAKLSGTHSGALDLSDMNMGIIPATDKAFSAAQESGKVTVKGDKVTSWATAATEGAGLIAILGQLGIKPPAM